jgi:ribonucleoside-diphosphate reductase alpha chain
VTVNIIEQSMMRVRKRNGSFETADVNKIVKAVTRCSKGLSGVDPLRVATKTISGLYDGATTQELDKLSIQTSAMLTSEEPNYSLLAARLLSTFIDKEVSNQEIHSFYQSIKAGYDNGLVSAEILSFVQANKRKLNDAIDPSKSEIFEYFGLRTLYERYLLKHPQTREVTETSQYFFLRVACGVAESATDAMDLYERFSSLEYLPSSPTLFNSGTTHPQLSSCFLLDSPEDDLGAIYDSYKDVALLSKYAGGIGISFSRVRSRGSLIKGTNGASQGIIPFLKTLDSSVSCVNQGSRRKGACCVYLETWHAEIEEFLELRDNTGEESRRTHNLNLANWIPDLFMERVEKDEMWSLFDPKETPYLVDLYGDDFRIAYVGAESKGLAARQLPARELYGKMMRTLAQTGNGWITFKDKSNLACNQTAEPGNVVHLSNLCTEILEINSAEQTAVCNLGSINLSRHVSGEDFDFGKLAKTVRQAVLQLDRVIDKTFYPTEKAKNSNDEWRPIGLGLMGLQDVFFQLGIPFDSEDALELSTRISEAIYFHALSASCDLAEAKGAHKAFSKTRAAKGKLQFDLWDGCTDDPRPWEPLKARIKQFGLRNSLLIAIAPTATIASIAGCYECIEPQISNLFKRETLSGEFLQINRYLVEDLKRLNLWNDEIRNRIMLSEGSIAGIDEIPEAMRKLYRTVWEIPQKALIDLAAARGEYIDQSQSLNLFMENPNIGTLSSMYMYAWKQGLKTTYYLRSRPATGITKTTVSMAQMPTAIQEAMRDGTWPGGEKDIIECLLENPESCEACS